MTESVTARSLPLVVGVVLLGGAVYWGNGLYSRGAIGVLLVALAVFAHAGMVRGRWPAEVGGGDVSGPGGGDLSGAGGVLRGLIGVGIVVQMGLLLWAEPLNDVRFRSAWSAWPYYLGWVVVGGAGVLLCVVPRAWLRVVFGVMLAAVAAAGVWAIRANASPRVDVFYYQQDSAGALLRGENPYTLTFPNPYETGENWVFAPGAVSADGSRILFGYPYLPVTLFAVVPGYLLGDYRFAHLGALLLAAGLVGAVVRSRTAIMAMALLLTHPRLPWVIEWGWTEPVTIVLLAATLCAVHRNWRWTFVPLGLLLASKQYMPLLLPLVVLAISRGGTGMAGPPERRWRSWAGQWIGALLVAAGVSLPLVVWDFGAFWSSAVTLQFAQPFRADALSVSAMVFDLWGVKLPTLLPVVAAVAVAIALTRRLKPSAAGLAWGVAIVLPVLFVLSKQAFANYYFLVSAGWCLALAFEGSEPESSF